MAADPIVYCLTRDRELAAALDDAAGRRASRSSTTMRHACTRPSRCERPTIVVVDTGAVRAEYGDAGLGPVFDFLRSVVPDARLVRATDGRASATSSLPRRAPASSCFRPSWPRASTAVAAACAPR